MAEIRALALNCTLTKSPEPSSTELLTTQILRALADLGAQTAQVRVIDENVAPGVEKDMGEGDGWPGIREQILASDILVICSPIWMGHMSSVAQGVLERLDAELSETDDAGRPILFGKVAVTGIVGNEDGAHKATADLYQGLSDVGFTLPAQGGTYWVGEAMQTVDYRDLDETPEAVSSATTMLARNAVHLATLLREHPYP
ncbi:NRAMP family metal ion transporter [Microbacterium sp. C448]|uniref:flavodoxin family protein n=1 Tax=Microbacterium sp. C448 TaxID=1177594 RepID=UPI0003DE3602|nr:NAD(P)H-dependent oxidoreductase [Microbacterium sp. C448]CDJ99470.1 NRAMP family metal ion transporter [Microbacterium sp. C448]